jgi:hypothetical protein
MRIWGYILIVLNIGAASAFLYFATQVWKARTEWQLALVRQQLAIDGLPIEPPPDPKDLNEGSVPFSLQVGGTHLDQIKSNVLKTAIPTGGTQLGTNELVTNQTKEVERVRDLIFAALAFDKKITIDDRQFQFLSPEKRQRLLATLIGLAKGDRRHGAYALYRDLRTYELVEDMDKPSTFQPVPDMGRYDWARRELHNLGRTPAQVATLDLLEAIGKVQEAITLSLPKDVEKARAYAARIAVAKWLRTQIPYAAPDAFRSPNAPRPTASDPLLKNEELERLESKLKPLIDPAEDANDPLDFTLPKVVEDSFNDFNKMLMNEGKEPKKFDKVTRMRNFRKGYLLKYTTDENKAKDIRAQIETAVKDLSNQVGAENGLSGPAAAALVPFMADLAANPFDTQENVDAAKARLLELLALRATTESEKQANAALVEIFFSPKPFPQEKEVVKAQREVNIDTVGLATLRAYFEEAIAKSSAREELPEEAMAARSKVAGLKPLRDPGQKRRDIAFLLYHLDGYLAIDSVTLAEKTIDGSRVPAYDGDISARVRWFKLMFPAIAPNDPQDDTLDEKVRADAVKLLDQVHKERAEWHRRVAAIVGLEAYVKPIEEQASELAMMTVRLRPLVAEEQTYYEKQRQDYIFWLIELNSQIDRRLRINKEEEAIKAKWTVDSTSRENERIALQKDLAKEQADAKTALTDLEKKVQELFLVTRKLGEAQDALLGLELQLREIELERKAQKENKKIDK